MWMRCWWCEEVSVDPQRLGSIRTFSSGSTILLSGGLSTWIDGVAAMKVDFVVALVVVVAKVDSLRLHRLLWWQRLLVVVLVLDIVVWGFCASNDRWLNDVG
ncbi:transmembrane protein, putative [Medicago truncatula]|uniref:Transmembrane protein, putative n=1 Tax=Medicago truncatula TaxID=3880 RepID=G7JKL5_MEDTR|nr:transmembrane protein, putative [Medicago truncatula]